MPGVVVHACNPSYSRGRSKRSMNLRPAQAVSEPLSQKQNTSKVAKGVDQVIEHLPSKCKAVGSIPSTKNKNKK
jgi:hypothetical protein